jgi:methyl-accepting chemotaxis protein
MRATFVLRSISAKAIALIVAMIVVSIIACTVFTLHYFDKILGTDRLQQNLAAAEMIINPNRDAYVIRDGQLYAGDHKFNGDFNGVDDVARAFGGVATIFQGDLRISTTVKKKDGTRAIGTRADPKVAASVLNQGKPYIGEAVVIGRPFLTAYTPLKDKAGKAVGIFVVAFEKSEFNKTMDTAILRITLVGLLLIVVCGVVGGYIYRRLFAPFKPLSKLMADARQGHYTKDVPYTDRQDEFGELSRVILEFNHAMQEQEELRKANEASKLRAAEEQKRAEAEAKAAAEALVVGTFGEGLQALAEENLSFRLTAEMPPAYQSLKDNFNQAIATSERNRQERADAAKRREEERIAAEAAQKQAEETAKQRSIELVVSSFGEGLAAMARRDLTYRLNRELPPEYRILQDDFNNAISQLEDTINEINTSAGEIARNCAEISQGSQQMAQRTERQAASLEETAAAVTEITSTVGKSAEGAAQASHKATEAKSDAERGNEVVTNAVEAMRQIAKSSSEITQIIGVMDEIAFQTNLLALNAGIEAARAGEAGRGFAVVASEVRTLAQRSAQASKEIRSLIKTSEGQVETGVKLVEESGTSLAQIVRGIGAITKLMNELAASQREQATALSEIDSAVNQMDQTTQQNAAMAEQSNAASEALAGYAKTLADLVARFEIGNRRAPEAEAEPETQAA